MFKKVVQVIFLIICLFFFSSKEIMAYEYKDEKNESGVNQLLIEIYDAKQQYEDLAGGYEESGTDVLDASSTSYWWPIGSVETTEVDEKTFAKGDPETVLITSKFGYRNNPLGTGVKFHSGLDISGGSGLGSVNIIAARDGVVVYPTAGDQTNCPYSSSASSCGGGYGNYVIIQHSDGNYTLYGHMNAGSITVTAGDAVSQGQVIGKMGSSGNSTGAHLHFEIREGQNSYGAAVDPLTYISADTPRASSISDQLLEWLIDREGHTTIDGDSYVVKNIGDGVRTVGSGVTLENNVKRFAEYGIDVSDYPVGSKIPISIVDSIMLDVVNSNRSYVESYIADRSITLKPHQIDALVSQIYNCGNIVGFGDAYKKYGDTQEFFDNWFFRAINRGTQFEVGLTKRRYIEWEMFHNGLYILRKDAESYGK